VRPLVLLRGGDVWAPAPRGRADVLVGREIVAVGALGAAPGCWPVDEVDCGGLRLLPGLIDAHAHLCGGGGEGGAHTRVPSVGLSTLTLAGVTTAIGLLGTDNTTRTVAESLAAARALAFHGLTALCYTGGYEVPPVTLTGSVRGDIVHIDRIVAVGEVAISDHRSSQPTFDELMRIAADAHVAGMMTGKAGLLHLHLGDGERGLSYVRRALAETELPPRTFHPTHCNRNRRLWAEAMALGAAGVPIDVTAFPDDDTAADDVAAWLAAGLPPERITMSSDAGGCMPDFDADGVLRGMGVGTSATLLASVRSLVQRGVALDAALATCTSNVASLFRLAGKGRLKAGLDGDVIAVDDRLRVVHALAGGRWMVRDGVAVERGWFETAQTVADKSDGG
jgi:beta-aspartyl-dipeptidase (metallo-type)